MKRFFKKPYALVACLAILCLVLSFFGALVNSSGNSVDVQMVTVGECVAVPAVDGIEPFKGI